MLDPETGRKHLSFPDGSRNFFPSRHPESVHFPIDESDPNDRYARLYTDNVVDTHQWLRATLLRFGKLCAGKALDGQVFSLEDESGSLLILS